MTARMKKWLLEWAPVMPALAFLAAIFFAALIDNGARSLAPPGGAPWYAYYLQLATDLRTLPFKDDALNYGVYEMPVTW